MSDTASRMSILRLSLETLKTAVEGVVAITSSLQRVDELSSNERAARAELIYEFQERSNPIVVRSINSHNNARLDPVSNFHGTELLSFSDVPDTLRRYNSCPVNKTTFRPDTQIRKIIRCGHIFEKKAIESWLTANNTCPMCRGEVDSELTNMI